MKQQIIEIAKKYKISDIGICAAEDYNAKEKRLGEKASFSASQNVCPDWARSIIVCTFAYFSGEEKGNISRYAQGMDYHAVAKEKMEYIAEFLRENSYIAEAFADTGNLNERVLAQLSGLAFIGKNKMAISQKFGSYFFIGYILTDCPIEPDEENKESCTGCGKCLSACPLGALSGDNFCEEKCLSYITQKKGELSHEEKVAMRKVNTIWGCDICQEVCPHNINIEITDIEEFRQNRVINLEVEEDISNKKFQARYKDRAFSWRGKSVLLRNQKAIYNRKKN